MRLVIVVAAVCSVACGSRAGAPVCGGASPAAWPADVAPGQRLTLRSGWSIQSSARVAAPGSVISTAGFLPLDWYPARVPSTVVGTLVEDGLYGDPFTGMSLRTLPGMTYPVGSDFTWIEMSPESPFAVAWWYRTTFELPAGAAGAKVWLTLDGVTQRANVWLNGHQVGGAADLVGAYRSFELDVTCAAVAGASNVVAIEVFPPRVDDLAHTWVDWNPSPPDKNMGLWRDVWISLSGPAAIREPQVRTRLELPSRALAHLEVSADVSNASDAPFEGTLRGSAAGTAFAAAVSVPPRASRTVTWGGPGQPSLDVDQPALWWPAQYGRQDLQTLELELEAGDGRVSDRAAVRFGIREVASELTPEGHRVFTVNGQRILVRGAGWARDLFFMERPDREARELSLVRDLGLNTVRFEGKFPSEHLLDLADEQGVLVLPGWCCCDRWEQPEAWGAEQYAVAAASMRSMAVRLRNRPSVLAWLYGSDLLPPPKVEELYLGALRDARWPNPAVASAGDGATPAGGPTGMKMRGPYQWVPPSFWLADVERGGAFGFATEISPGPAVPEVESLRKMLGNAHLWPIDDVWNFHAGGGDTYGNVEAFTTALEARYGKAVDVVDYARKAQAMTYEAQRAMFESYSRRKYVATGVVQWMLNNAWPGLIWHLYDHYLAAGGGYYGTKKALEPVHVQFSEVDRLVVVVNSELRPHRGLAVTARVLDLDLTERWGATVPVDVEADGVATALVLPEVPATASASFVRLELTDAAGEVISTNLYWQPAAPDVIDWANPGPYGAMTTLRYADLTALANLATVAVAASASWETAGGERVVHATVTNPGAAVAFMVRLRLTGGPGTPEILPTRWEDNFVTLLPGETRVLAARYLPDDAGGADPVVEVGGWNVVSTSAAATPLAATAASPAPRRAAAGRP